MRLPFRVFARTGPQLRLGSIPLFPLLPFLSLPYTLGATHTASHMHIMGLTGMGKSKLLASMAAQLILQGYPCAVIDPHADMAQDVMRLLLERGFFRRPQAMQQVRYVDFANPTRFIPFNVLKGRFSPYETARNLVEACTRAWPSLAGGNAPQFENLLLSAATVLIDNRVPLTHLSTLLTDATYRERLLRNVADPQVVEFFQSRYGRKGALNESTLRRAFLLTYAPPLRYSLGQAENALDFRALMDSRISLICNLGGLDAQTQRLLGSLLTVGFETAALSRADLPPMARSSYRLILDEFSQFSAQSGVALERVLALTRKYGLLLTLAHQTWSQVDAKLQGALQNTMFITFRVGHDDAAWAAHRVAPFDPYRIQYMTQATPTRPAHPVYITRSEQQAQWEHTLQSLRPRDAVIRVRGRTILFKTERVAPPTPKRSLELQGLLDQYAEQLLTPQSLATAHERSPTQERQPTTPVASTQRSRAGVAQSEGPTTSSASSVLRHKIERLSSSAGTHD